MKWPELPEEWTYRPPWVPPYIVPHGWPDPLVSKKEVIGEKRKPYFFFDTPDYDDCFKKTLNITNYGIKAGIIPPLYLGHKTIMNDSIIPIVLAAAVAMTDLLSNKQLSYANAFGRVAFHFGRIGGSAMLYSSVTCAVANLRGNKDDEWNHIIGGASIGLIWGYKYHSTAIGSMVALAGAFTGFMIKRSFMQDWVIYPKNMDHVREEGAVLGSQNFGDLRIGKRFHLTLEDPGRKGLE